MSTTPFEIQKSLSKSWNPTWNLEISLKSHWNLEISSEILKSSKKSRNPVWNHKISKSRTLFWALQTPRAGLNGLYVGQEAMLQPPPHLHPVGLTFVVTTCLYVCAIFVFSLISLLLAKLYFTNYGSCNRLSSIMLRTFTSFSFNRQCVCFIPQIQSLGELPFSLFDDVLKYKTTHNIHQLTELNFKEDHYTTSILIL